MFENKSIGELCEGSLPKDEESADQKMETIKAVIEKVIGASCHVADRAIICHGEFDETEAMIGLIRTILRESYRLDVMLTVEGQTFSVTHCVASPMPDVRHH